MLTVEVHDHAIFVFYKPINAGSNVGGYLGRIFQGGTFHGISLEALRQLGTGSHSVLVDERERSADGSPPVLCDRDQLDLDFDWALFTWQVGACSRMELWNRVSQCVERRKKPK